MSTTVRIAIAEEGTPLSWPKRCAACGESGALEPSTTRVGRVASVRPNLQGGITMKSDVMYVSTPMCAKHAGANALANRILEKSPLMSFLRGWIYIGVLVAVTMIISLVARRSGAVSGIGGLLIIPLLGIVGGAALAWANKNWQVRPVRFDPDMDVIEVDFRNDVYAAEFKRANRKATDSALTEPLPWWRRSATWKIVVMAVFVLFLLRLTRAG